MSDQLFARVNRRGTRVVCGRRDCGYAFGTLERAEQTFRSYLVELGGQTSTTEYVEVRGGELYVSPLPGFMRRSDGVYDASPNRVGHWRANGLPPAPRLARGEARDPMAVMGARFRCARCREESTLDASRLGVVQRLVTSPQP